MQLLTNKNLKKIKMKFRNQIRLKLMYKKEILELQKKLQEKERENSNLKLDLINAKRIIILEKTKNYSK